MGGEDTLMGDDADELAKVLFLTPIREPLHRSTA
jgi:hypothetical protein